MQEIWVWSLGWEDPLEKETSTHSSTLAWKIPWIEEPGRLQFMGLQRVGHDWAIPFYWIVINAAAAAAKSLQSQANFILKVINKPVSISLVSLSF